MGFWAIPRTESRRSKMIELIDFIRNW